MPCKAICLTICSLLAALPAEAFIMCGAAQQGGIIRLQDNNLAKVKLNGKTYNADKSGELAIAFARDAELQQPLKIFYKDGAMRTYNLQIAQTKWDVQEINGLPSSKVAPAKTYWAAIQKEQKDVGGALNEFSNAESWKADMLKPAEGRTSGNFGGQRIMNGQKKNPHQGWDIAVSEGTEIKAPADGIVTLSDGSYFYSGNVVVLEHGHNLSTVYAHLQKTLVKKGDKVQRGQVIGLAGKTGRATGSHLHWGASLNGVRFDAKNLLNFYDKDCKKIED